MIRQILINKLFFWKVYSTLVWDKAIERSKGTNGNFEIDMREIS